MAALANWNGAIMPLDEVRIPALDRGFLFGDAVYEALRVYRHLPFHLDRHFVRLQRSLHELSIVTDIDRLRERLLTTLKQSGVRDGLIYLQITRGAPPRRSHPFPNPPVTPNELLWIEPYPTPDPLAERRPIGVDVILTDDLRWHRRDIKTINLLGNCLAAEAARQAGAYEALLVDPAGLITEGSHTSAFAVRDGKLLTSPLGPHILPGITRQFVLELADDAHIPVEAHPFRAADIERMDEIFLTGTSTEVLGVKSVNHRPVGAGGVGPITQALANAYQKAVERWLASEEPS